MHVHTSNTLCASTSYVVPMGTSAQEPMMQFATLLLPLRKMIVSTWDENNYMCFLQPYLTPFVDKSSLCSIKMELAL